MTLIINPNPEERTEEEKRLVELLHKPDPEEVKEKIESGEEKLKAEIALDYFRFLFRTKEKEMDCITREHYRNAIDVLTTYLQVIIVHNKISIVSTSVVNQYGENNVKINYVEDLKL